MVSCPAAARQPASWPAQEKECACTAPSNNQQRKSGSILREDEARGNCHPCEDCPQSCMESPLR
eukprot:2216415-Heterocapsa_arctica.AAC.1